MMMKPKIDSFPVGLLHDLPASGFIRQKQLIGPGNYLPVSASCLWQWVANGHFPAPVKLSPRVSAWRVEDVRAFFVARANEVR